VASLLDLTKKQVIQLAARVGLQVTYEAALGGLVFSAWAVKRLLVEHASNGANRGGRLDRQALLHAILEDDPARALDPPTFERRLEDEIARVADLDEPVRSLRATELVAQWRDAKRVAQAASQQATTQPTQPTAPAAPESSSPSQPAPHVSSSAATGSAERLTRLDRIFSGLSECL
jgi:hypothetical protein